MKNKKKNKNKKKEKIMPVVSKPMPGEIDTSKFNYDQYHDLLEKCSRQALIAALQNYGWSPFSGEVIKIKGQKGSRNYLFKSIYFNWEYGLDVFDGVEDHIWILNAKSLEDANIKVGDKVLFTGDIYFYERLDGTCDAGVKNAEFIEKLDDYELPSDEELTRQAIKSVVCEVCCHSEQCSGMCIENYSF